MWMTGLKCWSCGAEYAAGRLLNLCICGKPLRVEYDLESAGKALTPAMLKDRPNHLWRYREVLPLPEALEPETLGEGGTPLLPADSLGAELGMQAGSLWIKDESVNP